MERLCGSGLFLSRLREGKIMLDIIYPIAAIAFFAVCGAFVRFCEDM